MILVVDDHADTCKMVERLLKMHGLKAQCVNSGFEALAVLETGDAECLILDDTMPGMTGLEVLRTLRVDRDNKVPVIIYSASTGNGRKAEALRLGAAEWIVKGTPFSELLGRVNAICASQPPQ